MTLRHSLLMSDTYHTDPPRVLVTGASRGIGRATALAFARTGAAVALLARESPELRDIVREMEGHGASVVAAPCDVRDAAAVERAIGDVDRALGGIDVLVNNAGGGRYAPFGELTESDWDDMLSLNVTGLVNVTRSVLPLMHREGRGHVINIGSVRGLEGAPTMTAYTASKFAVTGLTRALRQELEGSGILVSLVSPGGVKTGFGGLAPEEKDPTWMDPSTIADLVVQVAWFRGQGWITEVTIMPEPAS
jgi:3-oxoacyl-[acyl-carrier protein] reductase